MCTFIGVECMAANALIELYEKRIQMISFEQLADYGLMVVDAFERENEGNAVFIFNQEKINGLILNYSEYFFIKEMEDKRYIGLREGVDINVLKEHFRWSLSYEMLRAVKYVNIENIVSV